MLSAPLEELDPTVNEILQNVRLSHYTTRYSVTDVCIGEKTPKTLHQPHPFRKLHFTGRARCPGECDAESVCPSPLITAPLTGGR